MTLSLPIDPDANALLARSPLALLIGMLLDQQVPMERAFSAPHDLARRLGHEPTAEELAGYDPEALTDVFSERPALHRYPRAMAARVQELARLITTEYDGDAARIWSGAASGQDLLRRVSGLPGFGPQRRRSSWRCSASSSAYGRTAARGSWTLWRGRHLPFGRRHRGRGIARQGTGAQAGEEGRRQGGRPDRTCS